MTKRYFYKNNSVTISELARQSGIHRRTLYWRLAHNWTLSASVSTPLQTRPNAEFSYGGQSLTLRSWAKVVNIPYKTLYNRVMFSKWDIKEALTVPSIPPRDRCRSKRKNKQQILSDKAE